MKEGSQVRRLRQIFAVISVAVLILGATASTHPGLLETAGHGDGELLGGQFAGHGDGELLGGQFAGHGDGELLGGAWGELG